MYVSMGSKNFVFDLVHQIIFEVKFCLCIALEPAFKISGLTF